MKRKRSTYIAMTLIIIIVSAIVIIYVNNTIDLQSVIEPVLNIIDFSTMLQLSITILLTIIVLDNDKKANHMQAIGLIDFYENKLSDFSRTLNKTIYLERDLYSAMETIKKSKEELNDSNQLIDPEIALRMDNIFTYNKKERRITADVSAGLEKLKEPNPFPEFEYLEIYDLLTLMVRFSEVRRDVEMYSDLDVEINIRIISRMYMSGIPKGVVVLRTTPHEEFLKAIYKNNRNKIEGYLLAGGNGYGLDSWFYSCLLIEFLLGEVKIMRELTEEVLDKNKNVLKGIVRKSSDLDL